MTVTRRDFINYSRGRGAPGKVAIGCGILTAIRISYLSIGPRSFTSRPFRSHSLNSLLTGKGVTLT